MDAQPLRDQVLYTREEAAEVFKISTVTLDRMIKAGKIEIIRIGKSIRIPKREMTRVIEEGVKIDESW